LGIDKNKRKNFQASFYIVGYQFKPIIEIWQFLFFMESSIFVQFFDINNPLFRLKSDLLGQKFAKVCQTKALA
jgi:hypothetical protein